MLNVRKVTGRIQRDCKHAKQLVLCMLTDRDVPLPIALVVCGLCYRQTGVKLAAHARIIFHFQSCWMLAAVQKPLFSSPGVLLSLGKSSHADAVCVCV